MTTDEIKTCGVEMTPDHSRWGEGSPGRSHLEAVPQAGDAGGVPDPGEHVPVGTVLLTGTGIIVTKDAALEPGDVVSIRVAEIGELSNPAEVVG